MQDFIEIPTFRSYLQCCVVGRADYCDKGAMEKVFGDNGDKSGAWVKGLVSERTVYRFLSNTNNDSQVISTSQSMNPWRVHSFLNLIGISELSTKRIKFYLEAI